MVVYKAPVGESDLLDVFQRLGQPMRNQQYRHLASQGVDGFPESVRRLFVKITRCLVKDQYLRAFE